MRTTLVLTTLVAMVGVLASSAGASPSEKTQICGQRKGPSTSWSDSYPGMGTLKFRGNVWTVFATGVSCRAALAATPGHLRRWAAASIEDHWTVKGWFCSKEKARGYSGKGVSSGSVGCVGPQAAFIAIQMYAPYTLAQIKQVAATGSVSG